MEVYTCPFCELCNTTDAFVKFAITWVQFEGWRCSGLSLQATSNKYDYVLLAEEDLYFQTDPFLIPKPDEHLPGEIYYSTSPYTHIGTDQWGSWLNQYNDSCCLQQLKEKPFLNSGILMASHRATMDLLEVLVKHWRENIATSCCWSNDPTNICDSSERFNYICRRSPVLGQTAMNYVIHFELTTYPVVEYKFPFTVPLCSHGTYSLIRDAIGRILTDVGGEPCSVVHMYNRYDTVKDGNVHKDLSMATLMNNLYAYVLPVDRLNFPGAPLTKYGIRQWVIDQLCVKAERESGELPFLCRNQCALSNCCATTQASVASNLECPEEIENDPGRRLLKHSGCFTEQVNCPT